MIIFAIDYNRFSGLSRVSLAFTFAIIAFTAMGKIPTEVFVPIAAAVTYWLQERSKENEIDRMKK